MDTFSQGSLNVDFTGKVKFSSIFRLDARVEGDTAPVARTGDETSLNPQGGVTERCGGGSDPGVGPAVRAPQGMTGPVPDPESAIEDEMLRQEGLRRACIEASEARPPPTSVGHPERLEPLLPVWGPAVRRWSMTRNGTKAVWS